MASIKVKFRPSSGTDRKGTIYYQIIHGKSQRLLLTDYHVYPCEWDNKSSMVVISSDSTRKPITLTMRDNIRQDFRRLTRIIRQLDDSGLSFSTDDVIAEFRRQNHEYTLFNFMSAIIVRLKKNGKQRTSETYASALSSFMNFRCNNDIMLDCLNSDVMEAYQAWHQQKGNTRNTISFYNRILRAVYYRAVENGMTDDRHPFRHVYTGVDKTIKKALPLQTIRKIKHLDLSTQPPLDYARDIFMLSFMLRGMSFIDMMEAYQAWHQQKGNTRNTISFYNRILRAVYYRAVENGMTDDRHPFRHVYTGVDKTIKKALPLQTIRKIKHLDLSTQPPLDYARDIFMLSFMLRGMSFIDMAYLKKADLANGHITYMRRKTGQQLSIRWTREMQNILDKYPENSSVYLLPIIRDRTNNERQIYKYLSYKINHNLKKVAERIGISIPLTLYVARHSWASIAKSEGVPLSLISEGMGHDSESTTRIYLASLDTEAIDDVNSKLINLL